MANFSHSLFSDTIKGKFFNECQDDDDQVNDIMEDNNMTTVDSVGENEHAWGLPVGDMNLTNLSDKEYLNTILGPRRMGYQVM